jgi:hypothetical protein
MAASLQGRVPGSRETPTVVKTLPTIALKTMNENTGLCDSYLLKCSHEFCVKVSHKSHYHSKPRL